MTESIGGNSKQVELCCPVVELRQYTLHPGKRDALIDLFDREFIESQEAVGIKVIGQFRDLEHPDRFVWLRGFRDMTVRAKALSDFYSGPIWKAHREAANATMIDSDNVLLLHPVLPTSGFSLENMKRPPIGSHEMATSLGTTVSAYFVTERSENTFPALPVRAGENVFVWFSIFQDLAAYENYVAALSQSERWHDKVSGELESYLDRAPEVLKLSPTARSQLRA